MPLVFWAVDCVGFDVGVDGVAIDIAVDFVGRVGDVLSL